MTDERAPSLAETAPELHKAVGESLCNVANVVNAQIGPLETSRMLFSLWLSFTSQYQAPEITAAHLERIASGLRSGATYARAN